MDVKFVRISEIKVGDRFRQDYGDIESLKESIKRFGIICPLMVDKDMNLVAGGRRYTAATAAGLETVPVQVMDESDELLNREVELEENLERKDLNWQEEVALKAEIDRIKRLRYGSYEDDRLSGWSTTKTAELLGESKANVSRDLELAEASSKFPDLLKEKTKRDAYKKLRELKEAIILKEIEKRTGDKAPVQWKWASEHYMVGDAFEGLERMRPGTAHLIECDPPYGIQIDEVMRYGEGREEFNELSDGDFAEQTSRLSKLLFKIGAENSYLLFWFAFKRQAVVFESLRGAGWDVDPVPAIWVKERTTKPADARSRLMGQYESFYVCRKGTPTLAKPSSNVFMFSAPSHDARICLTEKPIELYDALLDVFLSPGMRVVCPFLGSGNFMLSCYRRNIPCYGWDTSAEMKEKFLVRVKKMFEV